MDLPDLASLFDFPVHGSLGLTTPDSTNNLSSLSGDEVPQGFNTWAEKRQREFRAGRHHARAALQSAGAVAPIQILRDDDGVPHFPAAFRGSITHTGKKETLAAAVVTATPAHLGIDAEVKRGLSQDLRRHVLSASEEAKLAQNCGDKMPLEEAALLAFSAKEAFYKCVFPASRLRFGFLDVEFNLPANQQQHSSFRVDVLAPALQSLPRSLEGRFFISKRWVICAMAWSPKL